jgi:multidrug efflux pump subunit AcrA (membrane-fusion protein)
MNAEDTNPDRSLRSLSEKRVDSAEPVDDLDDDPQPPKRGLRRFLLPGLFGLLVLGIVGWVVARNILLPLYFMSQMKPQLTRVQVASPKSSTIEDSSDYVANLNSRQSVTLQPRVSGQISRILVRAGDRVQAGTPLIQIDAAEQRALVNSRESAVESAAAEVDSAQADVANAQDTLRSLEASRASAQSDLQLRQREYDRNRQLFEEGAISRQILDERENALQTARAEVREIEANIRAQRSAIERTRSGVARNQRLLEQARANVNEVEAQLQYYTITAPFTGIVGDIPVKEGDFVSNSTQLLTFTQNEQLEVEIAVPLERASDLRQGQRVQLLDSQNKVLQTGRISFIAPNVDPQAQSVLVKAVFENPKGRLRADQYTRARIIWETRPGVLVPTSIISRLGGRDFVFVATPFKNSGCEALAASGFGGPGGEQKPDPEQIVAAQKPVQLGKIVGNDQEVLEGINANDRIITSGILSLQNCMAIEPQTQAAQPQQ